MRILNFGSLNIDHVYSVSHIVRPGETISSAGLALYYGGKGLNQSIAAAKAGAKAFHAGRIGHDGEGLLRECAGYGVDTTFIQRGPEDNGHTFIQVDENGQNSIVLFGGSNRAIGREHMDWVLEQFQAGDMLILQNEINGVDYLISRAAELGIDILLNPSPCGPELLEYRLELARWLVLNEVEGEQLTGAREPEAILSRLEERYPRAGFVLTLGEQGAWCRDKVLSIFQPCFRVEPVDTTAAGDTFLGYFAAGIAEGLDMRLIMERAAAAAAIAITRRGAAPSIPERAEVEAYLEQKKERGEREV